MVEPLNFATHTALALGLQALIVEIETRTSLRAPVKMFIAGGMAFHLYTGSRVTRDVDAEFSKRIALPHDIAVETADGSFLVLDTTYNSSFALMHEDYLRDAVKVPLGTDLIEVFVLSPLDLVVSKIARLHDHDRSDIAEMIRRFRITGWQIEERAEHALKAYVGNVDYLRMNLREVLELAAREDSGA